MNGIEKYIRENIGEFDAAPVPEGSKDAFLQKIHQEKRRRKVRTILLASGSIAAAAAIAVSFVPGNLASEIENHHRRLAAKEMEIIATLSESSPELIDEVTNTIRVVVSETIPLEEQLSDEMGDKAKRAILKEYYDCKYRALEQISDQYMDLN